MGFGEILCRALCKVTSSGEVSTGSYTRGRLNPQDQGGGATFYFGRNESQWDLEVHD